MLSRTAETNCRFQSLRGFGVGWSLFSSVTYQQRFEFQSLRGFGVGWSVVHILNDDAGHHIVSIPERVWGWLEHPAELAIRQLMHVSIPERVWGWLEPIGFSGT